MIGLGTLVNVITILVGGTAGLLLKKVLTKRITETIMQGIGLAVIIIGIVGVISGSFAVIDNTLSSEHILLMVLSLAIGAAIGELLKIEQKLATLASFCEKRFAAGPPVADSTQPPSTFVQGFVTATLVYCVGSMAIVGALEDGINGNSDILFAKSLLDGITAMVFASTMGVGVLLSAVVVGVYQGLMTMGAVFIAPYMSATLISQISIVGSVLILAIGLNLLNIAKIKVGNLLPAMLIPVVAVLYEQLTIDS
ncbi:MAG: DUF554 domain-containing protein [Oscillospiraceae bacterium]|nr:DUF554 domain-containing protein [Oscillospiraceae bacterium]